VASIPGEVEVTSTACAVLTPSIELMSEMSREVRKATLLRLVSMWRLSSRFVISHHSFYNDTMPTYQYLCNECGHEFEVVQSFSDEAISACEKCQGAVRKVYNSVGIVFKGSGFYKTDSRSSANSKSDSTPSTSANTTPAPTTSSTSTTSTTSSSSD
jgi:putative FmdB family regulatory protein